MNLLLDMGNSRLKWGLTDGTARPLVAHGSVAYDHEGFEQLTSLWRDHAVDQLCYASVISHDQERVVLSLLPSTVTPSRFVVSARFGSLQNEYATPETLGIDRWAAAIGAWTKVQAPCLVISAGTATTIDVIDVSGDSGLYRGGLIIPGVNLMLQSLRSGTARLPEAMGHYRAAPDVPDNTDDAMVSGAIDATCGAIMRMATRLPADAPWLLTGGGAQRLQGVLAGRATIVDGLVLHGLAQI